MKTKRLSELEQEVMTIVWKLENCSIRDVLERVNQTKRLAYTTVATILKRLHEKGLVVRKEKDAVFIYSPKLSKEIYSKNLAQSFMSKFFKSFGDTAIASFANSLENLPKKKRDYLLKLLENNGKN